MPLAAGLTHVSPKSAGASAPARQISSALGERLAAQKTGAFARCITKPQLRHSNVKTSGSERRASRQDIAILELQFGQMGKGRPKEATRSVVAGKK
jgi:hypothetical protein